MTVQRLRDIPGFNIDKIAAAAGDDPDVLRMENLDTDIPPPAVALEATRAAIGDDDANSWLPFNGRHDLKEAVAEYVRRRGGPAYDPHREIVITCGEGEAMLDALLCLTDPGDEVILTDPTYAGMAGRPVRTTPTACIHTFPLPFERWAGPLQTGVHLVTPSVRQLPAQCVDPRMKCRSRMHWYLADREARPGA